MKKGGQDCQVTNVTKFSTSLILGIGNVSHKTHIFLFFRQFRFFVFVFSTIQKTMLPVENLKGCTIAVITAYASGQHMWQILIPGPTSSVLD